MSMHKMFFIYSNMYVNPGNASLIKKKRWHVHIQDHIPPQMPTNHNDLYGIR